jgi:hypothetical protein
VFATKKTKKIVLPTKKVEKDLAVSEKHCNFAPAIQK